MVIPLQVSLLKPDTNHACPARVVTSAENWMYPCLILIILVFRFALETFHKADKSFRFCLMLIWMDIEWLTEKQPQIVWVGCIEATDLIHSIYRKGNRRQRRLSDLFRERQIKWRVKSPCQSSLRLFPCNILYLVYSFLPIWIFLNIRLQQ